MLTAPRTGCDHLWSNSITNDATVIHHRALSFLLMHHWKSFRSILSIGPLSLALNHKAAAIGFNASAADSLNHPQPYSNSNHVLHTHVQFTLQPLAPRGNRGSAKPNFENVNPTPQYELPIKHTDPIDHYTRKRNERSRTANAKLTTTITGLHLESVLLKA